MHWYSTGRKARDVKRIEARDQVSLGVGRCLDLSLAAMSYRITRSAVTMMILALAVAFLSYVLFYGTLESDTRQRAHSLLQRERLMGRWVNRLTRGDEPGAIRNAFARGSEDRLREYVTWTGLTPDEIRRMKAIAGDIQRWHAWFESIPLTDRFILLGERTPVEFLNRMVRDSAERARFFDRMESMKMREILGDREETRRFTSTRMPVFVGAVRRIRAAQDSVNERIRGGLKTDIASAMRDSGTVLYSLLRRNGYVISEEQAALMAQQARFAENTRVLGEFISKKHIAPEVARKMNVEMSRVTIGAVLRAMSSMSFARWMSELMTRHRAEVPRVVPASMLNAMAGNFLAKGRLQDIVGDNDGRARRHLFALSSRTLWLVLVSFIVCLVGISNTMLMSVTERFSEIATMKCIGAMDGFIMLEFVLEALVQGVVGSLIGTLLGLGLALTRAGVDFGSLAFRAIPWSDVALLSVVCFLTGIVISAISAAGPSRTASKLPPMEAMRGE